MSHEIIINRMFTGAYLEDERNIGHEIINLYKPDSGDKHYVYLVPAGDYANEHSETEIDGILLVRGVHSKCLEVVAKATGIQRVFNNEKRDWCRIKSGDEFRQLAAGQKPDGSPLSEGQKRKKKNFLAENAYQKRFISENDICYGGVLVNELFANNPKAEQNMSLYITFSAECIQKVKEPFYLVTDEKAAIPGKHNEVINRKRLSGSASSTFFSEEEKENYAVLKSIMDNPDLWGENVEKFDPAKIQDDDTFSFFSVMKKEYDELAYSNAFAYFFEKYRILLEVVGRIAREKHGLDIRLEHSVIKTEANTKAADTQIFREKSNIDILITDEQTRQTIVIENKIKSGVHGEKHDLGGEHIKNQLDKYYGYVQKEYQGYHNCYLLFLPDYNAIDSRKFQTEAQKAFKPIYFSELYDGFVKCQSENPEMFAGDSYWKDFLNAIKKHSSPYDNNLEDVMKRKMKKLVSEARPIDKAGESE